MITLKQAVEVLDAQVASGENLLNREVKMACGSDMRVMSWPMPRTRQCF